jgi:hypothetical protein
MINSDFLPHYPPNPHLLLLKLVLILFIALPLLLSDVFHLIFSFFFLLLISLIIAIPLTFWQSLNFADLIKSSLFLKFLLLIIVFILVVLQAVFSSSLFLLEACFSFIIPAPLLQLTFGASKSFLNLFSFFLLLLFQFVLALAFRIPIIFVCYW